MEQKQRSQQKTWEIISLNGTISPSIIQGSSRDIRTSNCIINKYVSLLPLFPLSSSLFVRSLLARMCSASLRRANVLPESRVDEFEAPAHPVRFSHMVACRATPSRVDNYSLPTMPVLDLMHLLVHPAQLGKRLCLHVLLLAMLQASKLFQSGIKWLSSWNSG